MDVAQPYYSDEIKKPKHVVDLDNDEIAMLNKLRSVMKPLEDDSFIGVLTYRDVPLVGSSIFVAEINGDDVEIFAYSIDKLDA